MAEEMNEIIMTEEMKQQSPTPEDFQLQVAELTLRIAEMTAQQEQFQAVKREREERSIAKYFKPNAALPEVELSGDASGPSTTRTHEPISELHMKTFGVQEVTDIEHCRLRDSSLFCKRELLASTEPDIHSFVRIVLEEIIFAAKLDGTLSLRYELAISELKADFLIIAFNGFPIAAVEVKIPGKAPAKNAKKRNFGQLFDYMQRIRSFHGLTNVFGIFTNWDEWTISWLKDSDYAAESTNLDDVIPLNAVPPSPATNRILHISETYHRGNAKALATALYSLMKKIAKGISHIVDVPLLSETRSYIKMDSKQWTWKYGISVKKLSLRPPQKNTSNFCLLRDFRGGADGRVWLACHEGTFGSSTLAVIKFVSRLREGKQGDEAATVRKEVKRWHKLGITSVYGILLAGRHAIVMPFGFHFNGDGTALDTRWWFQERDVPIEHFQEYFAQAQTYSATQALKLCVTATAKQKLVHEDIQWRHVALFPNLPKITIWNTFFSRNSSENFTLSHCFIDLTTMSEAETVTAAKEKMASYIMEKWDFEL